MVLAFLNFLPGTVRGLFRHDPSTRAASVEFWVVTATVLLLVKFAVGSLGPRFMLSSRHINPGVQLLRILSHYSVSYSLGLMQPSSSKQGAAARDLFKVWAVLITTMQESVSIGRPYKPKEMSAVDLLTSLWSANQLRSNTAAYLKVPLWSIWSIHALRVIFYYVSDVVTEASTENMKLVTDYMATRHATAANACPTTMKGYRYPVLGEEDQLQEDNKKMRNLFAWVRSHLCARNPCSKKNTTPPPPRPSPSFTLELDQDRPELVTVEKVWNRHRDDRLLGAVADGDNRFKDVCLSFALYKLLRRRFFDFPLPEARRPATRRLVSDAILEDKNDYERAFRVTEVQLSFLQDFSYSKHAVVFGRGFPTLRLLLSLLMLSAASYLFLVVRHIPHVTTALTQGNRPARITHGVLITRCIILIIVCREVWEVGVYVASQWTKVLVICRYIRLRERYRRLQGDGRWTWVTALRCLVTEAVARIMFLVVRRGRWDREIQQFNLLIMAVGPKGRFKRFRTTRSVKLRSGAKREIFESLKALISESSIRDSKGQSESSVQNRNDKLLQSYLENAFDGDDSIGRLHGVLAGDTYKILAWHVATSLCEISLRLQSPGHGGQPYAMPTPSAEESAEPVWTPYFTAVRLSNYCAYLVPRSLVPENGLVANKFFEVVLAEAREALRGCKTQREIHDKLTRIAWETNDENGPSIVKTGAQLAVALEKRYGRGELIWTHLARFWAGFLLYLSASTRAAKHQIHLQGRGELTTHLWALLSHAGFLGETAHGEQLLDPEDLQDA